MKKQLLFIYFVTSLIPAFCLSIDLLSDDLNDQAVHVFNSLCYKLFNPKNEADAYKAIKAFNKLSHLIVSKNTKKTHNKLLFELKVIDSDGLLPQPLFFKLLQETICEKDIIQQLQKIKTDYDDDKFFIFLIDLIFFITDKKERHEFSQALFALIQAIDSDNQQVNNPILIKYKLVNPEGKISEEIMKEIGFIFMYLDFANPITRHLVVYFFVSHSHRKIKDIELEYPSFIKKIRKKQNY